jgi:hypothetical protein
MDHPSLIAQSQYQVKAGTLFCQGNAKIPGIDFNGSLPFCVGDTKKRPRSFKILYAATPPIHLRLQVFSPEKKGGSCATRLSIFLLNIQFVL